MFKSMLPLAPYALVSIVAISLPEASCNPCPPWDIIGPISLWTLTVILTVVNRFSMATHLIALPKFPLAQKLVDHVVKIYGLPNDIIYE